MPSALQKIEAHIEAQRKKLEEFKAKKQKIEARQRTAETKKKSANDTRRKILVGAAILAKVDRDEWPKEKLLALLDTALTRSNDRALFDLAPLTEKPKAKEVNSPEDSAKI